MVFFVKDRIWLIRHDADRRGFVHITR
jgi:hypothetical protein